jgi:pimeloyl-ACP methyl ester carboxylesterase
VVAPTAVKNEDFEANFVPQSYWADIDGQKMHYLQAGSGPPLLLVHGLLGGSFCWRLNIPVLARTRTVYAVDLVGLGVSDAPRTCDCSMRTQALRLNRFIEGMGLSNVDVVGSSWGGAVVLCLASLSDKLHSLVLAAPVNPWSGFGRERIEFFSGPVTGFLLPVLLPYSRRFQRPYLERLYGNPAHIPPGTLEGYSALITRRGRGHNLLSILRGWSQDAKDLRAAITKVKTPSLLIWGAKDLAVDPRSANALKDALPRSEVAALLDVGHLPFEEAPGDFNRLVLEFLGRTK